jgi:hypothetical protein
MQWYAGHHIHFISPSLISTTFVVSLHTYAHLRPFEVTLGFLQQNVKKCERGNKNLNSGL